MTDTVVFAAETQAEDPAYVAKMVAVAERGTQAGNPQPPAQVDQPATPEGEKLLAGKYKSAEELEKAYVELQKKLGAPKAETPAQPAAQPNANPIAVTADTPDADVATQLSERGLDFNAFAAEFNGSGELSAESYAKLDKAGIPKAVVDEFIQGRAEKANKIRGEILAEVGGEEQFTQVARWAAKNLSQGELEAYNAAVGPGSTPAMMKLAVAGLHARYTAVNGREPTLIHGETQGNSGDRYANRHEMIADQKNPRYRTDPAFREQVMQKASRSRF